MPYGRGRPGEGVGSMRTTANRKGRRVKNWQNFADVVYGWPLAALALLLVSFVRYSLSFFHQFLTKQAIGYIFSLSHFLSFLYLSFCVCLSLSFILSLSLSLSLSFSLCLSPSFSLFRFLFFSLSFSLCVSLSILYSLSLCLSLSLSFSLSLYLSLLHSLSLSLSLYLYLSLSESLSHFSSAFRFLSVLSIYVSLTYLRNTFLISLPSVLYKVKGSRKYSRRKNNCQKYSQRAL